MQVKTLMAIDLETTGLNEEDGSILEIAARVLDQNLDVLDKFDGMLGVDDLALSQMDGYVLDMHTKNGLLHAAPTCELKDFVSWAMQYGELMFLGNSVTFDRDWVQYHCPELDVSYRVVDVSSFKRMAELAGMQLPERAPSKHRAASDIDNCIEDAKFFLGRLKL
jgi:oligoribonuclease